MGGARFSRRSTAFAGSKYGTDARFPSINRQNVVFRFPPDPNGVQGVAGSNPAVPTRVKSKQTNHLNVEGVPRDSLVSSLGVQEVCELSQTEPNSAILSERLPIQLL